MTGPATRSSDGSGTARLFVAALPDARTITRLGPLVERAVHQLTGHQLTGHQLTGHHGNAGRPVVRTTPVDSWHVTLRFLGNTDLMAATAAVARLATDRIPPTIARVTPTLTLLGRHVVVPVTGLDDLAAAVTHATDGLGTPSRHEFFGHITIGRFEADPGPDATIADRSATRQTDIDFPVHTITLMRSDLDRHGPHYTTVTEVDIGR